MATTRNPYAITVATVNAEALKHRTNTQAKPVHYVEPVSFFDTVAVRVTLGAAVVLGGIWFLGRVATWVCFV